MKAAQRRQQGKAASELIEEAVHALRTAPLPVLAIYYLGSLPFVLGLLFFWADMSRNPFAREHVVEAALGVSLLFLWMKFWQVVFARALRAHLCGEPVERLSFSACLRILLTQSALQPTGFLVLPLAALPVLPFAWAYAFYQNLTALGSEGHGGLREVFGKCVRHATLWPTQNNIALGYVILFGAFVFVNCCVTCGMMPSLIKTLFGIETVFSRSGWAMLNTTFFAAMFGLTHLFLDPILKALYVLRCFYGESVTSGADLKAELRHFSAEAQRLAACGLIALAMLSSLPMRAAETVPAIQPQTPSRSVSPEQLNRAIDEVIQQRKYTWRMPRERIVEEEPARQGVIATFLEKVLRLLGRCVRVVLEFIARIIQKIFGQLPQFAPPDGTGSNLASLIRFLLIVLAVAVVAVGGFLLYRVWKNRRRKTAVAAPVALAPVPDLTDENVGADQLPEDGWTQLARELLGRGEFRLALRAFYLASLAHLAGRNLIGLARFKSNRDYVRELQRRAHAFPNLLAKFAENVSTFDRVWYGTHGATPELVTQFASNVERIKAGG